VISNAYPSLAWVFDRFDIRHYFEHLTISNVVGCRKPDAAIYHAALAAMECCPHDAIFVDNKQRNVAAARALGMYALHLVRNESLDEGDLQSLAGLPESLSLLP
jgi:HAD superfamily hydrolase (TIGR01509 family)